MTSNTVFFFNEDYEQFLEWLHLNIESISWHNQNREKFEQFWQTFFIEGLSIKQIIDRFEYLDDITETGPILSWFHWLKQHFICFTFIRKQLTIRDLSQETHKPVGEVATILRNYFLDEFPEEEDYFNEVFRASHVSSPNCDINFLKISQDIRIPLEHSPNLEDETMTKIELTLYEEWDKILRKTQRDLLSPLLDIKDFRIKEGAKKHANIARDLILLIIITLITVFILKYANNFYEKHLTDQIRIYKPGFIDKISTRLLEPQTNLNMTFYDGSIKKFEDVRPTESQTTKLKENEIFTTESDITLSSWDSLPSSMNGSIQKKSIYEESIKGGYRDLIYGTNRVYRILMRSVDPIKVTTEIQTYLKRYGVQQVDKVKPGTHVPGGHYYNIYVPIVHLKEFLTLVMKNKDALLFENKTLRGKTPRGMNKVLIWIKSV